jgi:hypothetical protein
MNTNKNVAAAIQAAINNSENTMDSYIAASTGTLLLKLRGNTQLTEKNIADYISKFNVA